MRALGPDTFLLLSCAIDAQAQQQRDAIANWFADESEGGGTDIVDLLLNTVERGQHTSLDLETLRAVDSVYVRVLAALLEKFDFDFYLCDAVRSSDVGFSSRLREYWQTCDWEELCLCTRAGTGKQVSGVCKKYGCIRPTLSSPSRLYVGQVGCYLGLFFSSSLTEPELLSLRLMVNCRYLSIILRDVGEERIRVNKAAEGCYACFLDVAYVFAGEA